MYVYVLDSNGQPLMPTSRCGKVRRLLKSQKAKVVKRCPFTIQLLYETANNVQPVTLGVDAGSKHIGLSATTETDVLLEADVELRNDIVELLSTRREARCARRNRKTRYRKARFNNRTHSKHSGWLAPSVEQKIQCHVNVIRKVTAVIPVSKIIIEVAAFDTQLLKAVDNGTSLPSGTDYQNGEMAGFNTREYVLFRDNYQCRCCHGKSKDNVLEVHHIQSRKIGGDAPNNLVALCKTCHQNYHRKLIRLPENIHRGNRYNDAAFMGIMRWTVYYRLKELYPNLSMTYGYITKNTRIRHQLPKEHYIDARCITGHPDAISDGAVYVMRKMRCHNRQIHKFNVSKGGKRKLNQAPKYVRGFQLFDKVLYKEQECFITGRRKSGYFMLKQLDGSVVHNSAKADKLKLLSSRQSYIIERRALPPH